MPVMMPTLSMPLFVSSDDVITRMQLNGGLDGVVAVVENAIMGAQLHVQALLDGTLIRTHQDCMYQLDSDAFSGIQPGGVFRLELPSGFVRRDTPILVTSSSAATGNDWFNNANYDWNSTGWEGFQIADPFGAFTPVDMTLVKIDYNRGYLLVSANGYSNSFVRVQCDTGFEPGTNTIPTTGIATYDPALTYNEGDFVVYNGVVWVCLSPIAVPDLSLGPPNLLFWALNQIPMEQLPPTLYEAILSMVPVLFDSSQTTNRNQEAQPQYKKAGDHASMLLKIYERMVGFSFRPLWK